MTRMESKYSHGLTSMPYTKMLAWTRGIGQTILGLCGVFLLAVAVAAGATGAGPIALPAVSGAVLFATSIVSFTLGRPLVRAAARNLSGTQSIAIPFNQASFELGSHPIDLAGTGWIEVTTSRIIVRTYSIWSLRSEPKIHLDVPLGTISQVQAILVWGGRAYPRLQIVGIEGTSTFELMHHSGNTVWGVGSQGVERAAAKVNEARRKHERHSRSVK